MASKRINSPRSVEVLGGRRQESVGRLVYAAELVDKPQDPVSLFCDRRKSVVNYHY
ncbi:hypothetical protein BT96DRAFT_156836 [Gymnopus androsaceus JB14]|uniref:Uncharacterized protein n=1 Tax=Gymnopus androsaceus JB14 TaxID=1447944 RepID=A0A6A4GBK1_9AGAR|nr:hypothetical protein BT96DRAFT_156836 [Gymnopus androsaceus JB14]